MRTFFTDTILDLDPGPWALDPVTNLWVTMDGRVSKPAYRTEGTTTVNGKVYDRPKFFRARFLPLEGHIKGYIRCQCPKGREYVHRIVARAWIPLDPERPFVNHKDRDKTNNAVENLEWVTASENTLHWITQ